MFYDALRCWSRASGRDSAALVERFDVLVGVRRRLPWGGYFSSSCALVHGPAEQAGTLARPFCSMMFTAENRQGSTSQNHGRSWLKFSTLPNADLNLLVPASFNSVFHFIKSRCSSSSNALRLNPFKLYHTITALMYFLKPSSRNKNPSRTKTKNLCVY